jgi:N-acetyl-1-D-myo-inositol-2-amino-2-deoxy-alpha-D-glucopyranoside deacetylase
MTGGLLVITSHPDDEVLIAGGTLAACADAGMPTGVVCLTRGEHGPIADPALASPETLAEVREQELFASCAELRVGFVRCYRREDGNLSASAGGSIVRQLERIVRDLEPAAVITFGEDGLYWHPDHIATYEFSRSAVRRIPAGPKLYRAVWPEDLMIELVQELRRRELPHDLWQMPAEYFGTDDLAGCFELDVRKFTARKLRALRAHRTQLSQLHAFAALDQELAEEFLGVERFAPLDGACDNDLRELLAGV